MEEMGNIKGKMGNVLNILTLILGTIESHQGCKSARGHWEPRRDAKLKKEVYGHLDASWSPWEPPVKQDFWRKGRHARVHTLS